MTKQSKNSGKRGKNSSLKVSQFTTESVIRDVQRAIEGKEFKSIEEVNAYLSSIAGTGFKQTLRDAAPLSPKEEAQELAFEAMNAETEKEARALANRALAKDPDCLDALIVLVSIEADSPEKAIEGLRKAVESGERSLGAEFFKENKGFFWRIVETRPYMRARHQLADLLRADGSTKEAITHYAALLELNPGDNQGVRYPLLGAYLTAGNITGARTLLDAYSDDEMATFHWGLTLERLLSGDMDGAATALKVARTRNRFVELFFKGEKEIPQALCEAYALGSEDEAIICIEHLGEAWAAHPEVAPWLVSQFLMDERPSERKAKPKSTRAARKKNPVQS